MRLKNKVVLISGGAIGMGAVEARIFANEGAKVVIGDILHREGRQTEAEVNEAGGECLFVPLDVTIESAWQQAIAATISQFGKLDVLLNNAGINGRPNVEDTDSELWDRVMDVNAKGVFLGTKSAIPEMRKAHGGSIINISSTWGIVGSETSASYQASKGAVRLFTKCTAIQYASEGIRANSIHPGPIVTPMTEDLRADHEIYRRMVSRVPLARFGQPEDVAYGALFLASDESSFMTGSELVIDGGYTAQ